MKRNLLQKILAGLSFTSVLFVFQACYGTPQDFGLDFLLEGKVVSKTNGSPIKGIKVGIESGLQCVLTNDNGEFSFYVEKADSLQVFFEDIDSTENNIYQTLDTLITVSDSKIFLNIEMEEKL
jgi:putative lipoprotein (rSAM/lipoprotein system)